MPRYYFNVVRNDRTSKDTVGTEHATQHGAWEEATEACGQMMRDLDGDLKPGEEWRMEVTNRKREVVLSILRRNRPLTRQSRNRHLSKCTLVPQIKFRYWFGSVQTPENWRLYFCASSRSGRW